MISVIMSLYNETPEQLNGSIGSILAQTYKDFEFIIVVDNPSDKWRIDLVKSFKDRRIKTIINQKNIGLVKSLNKALKMCKGEYVARMDADDYSYPNRLERQLAYLNEKNLDLCGSNITMFNNDGDIKTTSLPEDNDRVARVLRYRNCIAHPSFFAKRIVYDHLNGYNEVPYCEDYDFLCRASKAGFVIGNCGETLLKYRVNESGISKTNEFKQMATADYVSKWYRKNDADIDLQELSTYIKTKRFERVCERYKRATITKNKFLCFKSRKSIRFIYYLLRYVLYVDIFIKDVYARVVG